MSIRTGFIGLGNIGKPMAERLLAAFPGTLVFDVVAERVEELAKLGAEVADSPRDLAARSDVTGICVRDDADVEAVSRGSDGVLAGAERGSVIAVHSTVGPNTVTKLGEAAAERGVRVLDACISGGSAGAQRGTLLYMVGGDAADLERARPAFETSAGKIVHTGPLGSGAAAKLCNNLMTYQAWLSVFEATHLARAAGLAQDVLEEVTRASGNLTEPMLAFLALHKVPAETHQSAGFQALLENFTTLAEKDLAATLDLARSCGIALPGTGLCQQLMARVYGLNDDRRR
jgi:3-hydroxyisobutyrate dehydrogenase-like beta-hydroxyacid dehydrogenase